MHECKLTNCAAVLITPDLRRAVDWYRDKLGFRAVEHFEFFEPFAAMYRDSVEIVLVQGKFGSVERNGIRYGAGFDVLFAPATPDEVDAFHEEIAARGVKVILPPAGTPYGVRQTVFEDVDGRWIGVLCIDDEAKFHTEPAPERPPGGPGAALPSGRRIASGAKTAPSE
jgi:catechol 2,3-dioxygenase-like lactoylglutathione lyase family enzyme